MSIIQYFILNAEKSTKICRDTADEAILFHQKVHPDAILLFRVGDFYETFGEDAIKASGVLALRSRGGAPTDRQRTS